MIKEVYFTETKWKQTHDNLGGVSGKIVFKEPVSYQDYLSISRKEYLLLDENKDKEIERLNKELEDLRKLNDANYKSFIDANKVIIELEEYLNKVIETSSEMERITCSFVLQYLKELKGEK